MYRGVSTIPHTEISSTARGFDQGAEQCKKFQVIWRVALTVTASVCATVFITIFLLVKFGDRDFKQLVNKLKVEEAKVQNLRILLEKAKKDFSELQSSSGYSDLREKLKVKEAKVQDLEILLKKAKEDFSELQSSYSDLKEKFNEVKGVLNRLKSKAGQLWKVVSTQKIPNYSYFEVTLEAKCSSILKAAKILEGGSLPSGMIRVKFRSGENVCKLIITNKGHRQEFKDVFPLEGSVYGAIEKAVVKVEEQDGRHAIFIRIEPKKYSYHFGGYAVITIKDFEKAAEEYDNEMKRSDKVAGAWGWASKLFPF